MNCKIILAAFAACTALVAGAQEWLRPGTGVANDHARGANPHDIPFVARGGGNPYGYRAVETAVGLTVLPWSCPNFESTVRGVRFNLGRGSYAGTYGLDTGLFSNAGDFAGVSVNLLGQYVSRDATGLQIGLVNVGGHARGLQIGVVNHVERLDGVQIGLLNFSATQCSLPILNIGW